ncbi:MAG: TonB-dependent receptor [Leptolyngbya sp. UWPOB_LEPTO1]|uniref:TonB-dependent receptor domain-containing protein n=1 Tax=Leptolyngbya sp. UWPOB_LEPTO1 TaxID=2815653 RepID=UPI001AC4C284|nr:TonB-dependent receptor [Leptolyngbya sp. UWPOB_LEPTO1]MBN8560722.1 TonB-dependent receptor [Leptolyngbya sp. UWPOB_LEPTO1]
MNRALWYSSFPLFWLVCQSTAIAESPVKRLQEFEQVSRSATLLSQSSEELQTDRIQITDVRFVPTATGVDVVLEAVKPLAPPVLTTSDRTLIAEFENAVLALPQGQTYQVDAPAEGIQRVTVQSIAPNRVQVSITSANETPTATIRASQAGITLAIVAPTETAEDEEEVVVTATRTQETRRDVPQSITTIDRNQLQQQFAVSRDVSDALSKLVPGLAPPNERNNIFGQTLRGRNVTVLIDGIPQATTPNVFRDLQTIDPSVIERIEVLRGATALYGDGATGGVINLITRTPAQNRLTATTEIGVNTSLTGSENAWGQTVQQTFSGTEGNVGYVLSAGIANIGSFFDANGDRIALDPTGQGGLSDADSINLFGKFVYTPDQNQRLVLSASRFEYQQDPAFTSDPIVARLAGRQRARVLEGLNLEDEPGTKNSIFNLEYTHQNVLGSRVRGQIYYRDVLARFFPFDARNTASLGRLIFQSRVESQRFGTRFDVETPLTANKAVNLLWGLDFSHENSRQPVSFFDPATFDNSNGLAFRKLGDRTWTPPITTNSLGLFGQLEARLSDRLLVRGGIRHERAAVSVDNFATIANNSVTGGKVNYDETLFNLGTVYRITPQVSAFASFSQGFSLADIGRVLRAAPNNFQFERVQPEPQKVNNYEIGLRGEWRNVQASISGFYSTSNLGTTFAASFVDIIRAPEQIYGVEATLDVQPSRNWNLGLTASLAEGRIDANNDGDYENFLDGFRIPPLKLTAYVENETLPGWRNRLQLLYSGTRNQFNNSTAFGRQAVNDYITVDFVSQIKVGSGTLQVAIENLLNADYFPVVSQLQTSDTQYLAGRGRSLSVRYGFTW